MVIREVRVHFKLLGLTILALLLFEHQLAFPVQKLVMSSMFYCATSHLHSGY